MAHASVASLLTISEAVASDRQAVAVLIGGLLVPAGGTPPAAAALLVAIDRIIADPAHGCILVARDGSRTVATISVLASPVASDIAAAAILADLAIADDYRGEGLGSVLLERAKAAARSRGWHRFSVPGIAGLQAG